MQTSVNCEKDEREKKLTRDQATSVLVVCEELGPRARGVRFLLCVSLCVAENLSLVHDNSTKFNAVMGNCHTVGPNEALVRSGKIISHTISLRRE